MSRFTWLNSEMDVWLYILGLHDKVIAKDSLDNQFSGDIKVTYKRGFFVDFIGYSNPIRIYFGLPQVSFEITVMETLMENSKN